MSNSGRELTGGPGEAILPSMRNFSSFFRPVVLVAALFAAALASAAEWTPAAFGWEGLRPDLTPSQAAMVLQPKIGAPLVVTKTKGGVFETWNYDRGGSLFFLRGRLQYWSVSNMPAPLVFHVSPASDAVARNRSLVATRD